MTRFEKNGRVLVSVGIYFGQCGLEAESEPHVDNVDSMLYNNSMKRKSKYTKELLEPIVKRNFTMVGVCHELGIVKTGSGGTYVRDRIDALGIDRSHFTGLRHFGAKNPNFNKTPLSQVMVKGSDYSLSNLKKRIIRDKIIPYICKCGLKDHWQGKILSLQLDHINGDRRDNRKENLRFICPNCHSQTDTFSSKNKKHGDNGQVV